MKKEEKIKWYKRWWVIVLFIILIIYGFYIYTNSKSVFNKEKFVKESLEEDGYEVISVMYLEDNNWVHLEMKSLGNKEEQVWDGLIALSSAYPNAEDYFVYILTPEETCSYSTYLTNYKSYMKSLDDEKIFLNNCSELDGLIFPKVVENINYLYGENIVLDYCSEIDGLTLYKVVHYQIKESESCEGREVFKTDLTLTQVLQFVEYGNAYYLLNKTNGMEIICLNACGGQCVTLGYTYKYSTFYRISENSTEDSPWCYCECNK